MWLAKFSCQDQSVSMDNTTFTNISKYTRYALHSQEKLYLEQLHDTSQDKENSMYVDDMGQTFLFASNHLHHGRRLQCKRNASQNLIFLIDY